MGWSGKPSLGLGQLNKGWNEVKDGAVQTSWGEALQAGGGGGGRRCKGPEAGTGPQCSLNSEEIWVSEATGEWWADHMGTEKPSGAVQENFP